MSVQPLKQALYDEYGGFADKRLKNISNDAEFIVDDRTHRDFGSDKKLYPWFCMMFVRVKAKDRIHVRLLKNVPQGVRVSSWAAKHKATLEPRALCFDVTPADLQKLSELGQALVSIVEHGGYTESSYKYVCPRTAKSLMRLEKFLTLHW